MRKIIAAISAMMIAISAWAQSSQTAKPETLTVKEVRIEQENRGLNPVILEIRWVDEQGNWGDFRYAAGKWFANKTFENVANTRANLPQNVAIVPKIREGGIIEMLLSDTAKLLFEFEVNDAIYATGIGAGSQFVVQKSKDGKIFLLPTETSELSPAPLSVDK